MGIAASAAFDALRVYALWEKSLWISIPVFVVAITPAWTNLYATALTYLESIGLFPLPFGGCNIGSSLSGRQQLQWGSVNRATTIVSNALVLSATWYKTFHAVREGHWLRLPVRLSDLLIRDGTIYFSLMFILNVSQFVLDLTDVPDVQNTLSYFIYPLSSMLMSRFILDLRDFYKRSNDETVLQSDLEFTRGSVSVSYIARRNGSLEASCESENMSV